MKFYEGLIVLIAVMLFFSSLMSPIRKSKENKKGVCVCASEKNIDLEKELSNLNKLTSLMTHVKSLDLPKFDEEKILKEIDFRIYMVRSDLVKHLGNEELNRLFNKQEKVLND